MRRIAFSWLYVQEVIYTDNLKPLCSSLEQVSKATVFPPPMRITEDGYSAWLTRPNELGFNRNMAVLGQATLSCTGRSRLAGGCDPFADISIDAAPRSETQRISCFPAAVNRIRTSAT